MGLGSSETKARRIDGFEPRKAWIAVAVAQAKLSRGTDLVQNDADVCGERSLLAELLFIPRTK
jgi:hypothetical protein